MHHILYDEDILWWIPSATFFLMTFFGRNFNASLFMTISGQSLCENLVIFTKQKTADDDLGRALPRMLAHLFLLLDDAFFQPIREPEIRRHRPPR